MSKYDWSGVPSEVKWIATDKDGNSWGHIVSTVQMMKDGMWYSTINESSYCIHIGLNIFQGNWQDSLEERPHDT